MSWTEKLRWGLVVPAGVAGFPLAMTLWMIALGVVRDAVGEPANYEPWFGRIEDAFILLGASQAAMLVVLMAAGTAPRNRRLVAWSAFAAGLPFAAYMGLATGLYGTLFSALLCGLAAVSIIHRLSTAPTAPGSGRAA